MSLHLGDEIFDVHTMPIQGDFNHLFVRQGTGLQGQSIFKTKLAFRYLYSMIVYCSFWGEGFLHLIFLFFGTLMYIAVFELDDNNPFRA